MEVLTMLNRGPGEVGPETARTIALLTAEWREKMGLPPILVGTKTVPASQIIFGTGRIRNSPDNSKQDRLALMQRAGFFEPKG